MKNILLTIAMCFLISMSFSQDWKKTKPDILYAADKDNNIFNVKVGIGTLNPKSALEVKGNILTDSMRISKVLHIGDSSFTFTTVSCAPLGGPTDEILSSVGRVAFGRTFPASAFSAITVGIGLCDPQNKLHLHEFKPIPLGPPQGAFAQFTNSGGSTGGTGKLATDGLLVGITPLGDGIMQQQEPNTSINLITVNNPINFNTNGTRKMFVWHDATNRPRVGIGTVQTPLAYLHIGLDAFAGSGYRTWMDKGVLMYAAPFFPGLGTDNMYVGLREIANDRTDAIINWGNNPTTQPNFTDRLRFVFTAATALGLPASGLTNVANQGISDGLEIARMISDGTNGFIGFGGDGYSAMQPPFPNPYNPYSNAVVDPGNTVEINSPVIDPANTFVPTITIIPNNTLGYNATNPAYTTTTATGYSGLRFTDLTSLSKPVPTGTPNTTTNVLSVDKNGDVILVPGGGAVSQVFSCSAASSLLTANGRIGLGNNNFYFEGQGLPNNAVGIGVTCATPLAAKLHVKQSSGSTTGSIGTYVVNTDNSNTLSFATIPTIGVMSQVTSSASTYFPKVAGWFEATAGISPWASNQFVSHYAIFVPGTQQVPPANYTTGGTVDIGFNYSLAAPDYLLDVNGLGRTSGGIIPSDSILKTNVSTFNAGLSVIRNINPKFYNYNGKGGFNTAHQYIGVMAQNLAVVAPYAVDTTFQKLDSTDVDPTAILNVYNEAILYTSINAIKQLDSTVTKATALPTAPVLISPTDGAVGDFSGSSPFPNKAEIQNAAFTWHSVSQGIVLYHAQFATDNSFTNIVSELSGITDTAAFFSACDTIATTYYWRVSAKNNTGDGAWSAVFSFTDTTKCLRGPLGGGGIRTATATSFNSSSDSRFKTNVTPLTDALDKVSQLNGVSYNWIPTPGYEFDTTQQIGFIAQDVQAVVPQVVHTDTNGYLTLDYGRIVPVLVEAIKDLKAQVNALQNANSKTTGNNTLPSTEVDLASANAMLWQNFPNPFGDGTVIRYFVPEKTTSAIIVFNDEFGNEIKSMELPNKGQKAELNISTSNLASGIYSYSLIVNGRIADTKQMLKIK